MRTLFIEDRQEINDILKQCKTCYVSMSDNDTPYVLPLNFGIDGNNVILHSAPHGRMWETLKKNPKVCIIWTLGESLAWQDEHVGCSYRVQSKTVMVEGEVQFIDDYDEKERLFLQFMTQYSDLTFKFNAPSIRNVGLIVVPMTKLTAKAFGEKVRK
ncbi:MAG: pyridoxamine 5'-phosphate oxidase family protein [Methylococcaceae bacterium]|nr:pyridoxamine 5'-phosphate oxidase family protein [Prolixibacteraceae bacterium]